MDDLRTGTEAGWRAEGGVSTKTLLLGKVRQGEAAQNARSTFEHQPPPTPGGGRAYVPFFDTLAGGELFDARVGEALAQMLGRIPIVKPNSTHLTPAQADCVEVGPVRIVGGVRPQNFDVGYRPDGVRFAFDSKTLNDRKSVAKNYQNMINDLATEATTVHSRFPFAVVAFMVVIPSPCLVEPQNSALIGTLERLGGRFGVHEPNQIAEAMTLVVWDPASGEVVPDRPAPDSSIRLERFSETVERVYRSRYKGLPPHADVGEEAEEAFEDEPGAS